jgi:hypothetical protein
MSNRKRGAILGWKGLTSLAEYPMLGLSGSAFMEMKVKSLGTIIATRKLALRGRYTVTVKIGKPRKYPTPPDDYYCPFQITGLGNNKIRYAAGVDAVQALWLALQMVGGILYTSEAYESGALEQFPGDTSKYRDLGFPVAETIRKFYPAKRKKK